MSSSESVREHPFLSKPHWTLLSLSVPVFFSLIAEPLTGLVDTMFVARSGSVSLAALGVGTAALSSLFWIFNFLAIGTQTNVAQAAGKHEYPGAISMTSLALLLSVLAGIFIIIVGWPVAQHAATVLGADGPVLDDAVSYMRIRLVGAPAVLLILTSFGAMRGLQDMRSPLWIAIGVNGINIVLDALFIPGAGPMPALGVVGAAAASVAAQTIGAAWAVAVIIRKLGWTSRLRLSEAKHLLQIGGDLFIRTGSLNIFLLLATRVANQAGVEPGAAHQAIRQFWIFAALGLDALALTAQSLVGYFVGSKVIVQARRVAILGCEWGLVLGVLMAAGMWIGRDSLAALLVPLEAQSVFYVPWLLSAVAQPLNAVAFVTDGVHWGTGDFAYLRNGIVIATLVGGIGLLLIDTSSPWALSWIWLATIIWISLRALFGAIRIWPGIGSAPLRSEGESKMRQIA
ncbi:MAG: MATE family efflux transporter [Candidatus Promineifilaceae bacterium]|nr:MATE family efflux transporter [Candidatus Promineifilaceae bacterium]